MKITIFGLTISSSWGNGHATVYRALVKALQRQGHWVTFYEKDLPFYAAHRDFSTCPFCELVLYQEWSEARPAALDCARNSDVVIYASYCPEGARIIDDALGLEGPLHVFYDLDTPITVGELAQGDLDYVRRDQIPGFALYLSFTGGGVLQELESAWGARAARPLYGSVDPEVHAPAAPDPEFRCSISYMGTYAADRQQKLETLFLQAARQLPEETFLLAGSLYPEGRDWPANVRRLRHVAPARHPAFYCSGRATLNITRGGMARTGYCPSGRLFEAAACGTAILSDYFEGLETFYTPGEELIIAHDSAAVVEALSMGPDDLRGMAARARQRTLGEHTGECRARQLLAYLDEARSARARSEAA
ncbi:MAG: glycosyltransferase [Acidobacteria bacterium]|nr:glycosyltransferase [Acidobacteriota bacterium]